MAITICGPSFRQYRSPTASNLEFAPGRKTEIILNSTLDIPNNLVIRAAQAILEATNAKGIANFDLMKRIPMGGGLGAGPPMPPLCCFRYRS